MPAQSLSRFLPLILVIVSLVMLAGASRIAFSHSAGTRYKECSTLAATNPTLALEKARLWHAGNASSPVARHCEALALYGLKNYAQSADLLLTLSKEAAAQKPQLAQDLLLQAVAAYKLAGQYNTAIRALSDRLADTTLPLASKARLLTERAAIYRQLKQSKEAEKDTDAAAKLSLAQNAK